MHFDWCIMQGANPCLIQFIWSTNVETGLRTHCVVWTAVRNLTGLTAAVAAGWRPLLWSVCWTLSPLRQEEKPIIKHIEAARYMGIGCTCAFLFAQFDRFHNLGIRGIAYWNRMPKTIADSHRLKICTYTEKGREPPFIYLWCKGNITVSKTVALSSILRRYANISD